jgi:hypothetical protein
MKKSIRAILSFDVENAYLSFAYHIKDKRNECCSARTEQKTK